MPYDASFYDAYEAYLLEKAVRANHDMMFKHWSGLAKTPLHVIDLGCGIGEYGRYGKAENYLGIDVVNSGRVENFRVADYSDPILLARALTDLDPQPNAFVSLFSCEPVYPVQRRYEIYEGIFNALPSIQRGLVSGFFYRDRRDQERVKEKGGVTSFQTIEKITQHVSRVFSEFRLTIHTPSKMFGPEVIEVWKFLARRQEDQSQEAQVSHGELQSLFRRVGMRV